MCFSKPQRWASLPTLEGKSSYPECHIPLFVSRDGHIQTKLEADGLGLTINPLKKPEAQSHYMKHASFAQSDLPSATMKLGLCSSIKTLQQHPASPSNGLSSQALMH